MKQENRTDTIQDIPPQRGDSALVCRLQSEEYEVFIWLLQAYSIGWIAETLGLEKRKVRTLAANIYKTLEVSDQRELIRFYVSLKKYQDKMPLKSEDLAYTMASYTDFAMKAAYQ